MCAKKGCCLLYASFAALISLSVHAGEPVWVFTAKQLPPIQHTDRADRVFVLDEVDLSLKALSFANPGNLKKATQRAMAVIQSPRGQAMIAQMRGSFDAIAVAWQHGIAKLPAVLVDEQYVVYGVFDVETAMAQVARYRDAH